MIKPAVPKLPECADFFENISSPYVLYIYASQVPDEKHTPTPSIIASMTNSHIDLYKNASINIIRAKSITVCDRTIDLLYPILSVINPVGISPRKIARESIA